jgi:hypothetical protein
MDELREELKKYIGKDIDRLKNAVEVFDDEPHYVRNYIAEQGLEYTPDQLAKMIDVIRAILREIEDD